VSSPDQVFVAVKGRALYHGKGTHAACHNFAAVKQGRGFGFAGDVRSDPGIVPGHGKSRGIENTDAFFIRNNFPVSNVDIHCTNYLAIVE
jgi:hypothetical protein